MTIKYFKYSKKTLPAIIAGSIEIYAESGQHIEKQLHKYENLKVGIGFIPNFQSNSVYQYRHTDKWGIWDPKSNTAWIQTEGHPDPMRTLRHELLHACQSLSVEAKEEIAQEAKSRSSWKEVSREVKELYPPPKWDIEIPVWVLQHDEVITDYFINKYLK